MLSILIPTLVNNMSSSRADVRSATTAIIDNLIVHVDNILIMQQFSTIILNGGKKLQAPMLDKLTSKQFDCIITSIVITIIIFIPSPSSEVLITT